VEERPDHRGRAHMENCRILLVVLVSCFCISERMCVVGTIVDVREVSRFVADPAAQAPARTRVRAGDRSVWS
jgi:hypothetical protein